MYDNKKPGQPNQQPLDRDKTQQKPGQPQQRPGQQQDQNIKDKNKDRR